MLKYIKDHMSTIDGIEIFPLISFIIFFTFFVLLLWYVATMKKSRVEEISRIPLEDEEIITSRES